MATVSLNLTESELKIFEDYAKFNHQTLDDAIKRVMFDKIDSFENEYDLRVVKEYEREKQQGTLKTYSHEEVWGELLS